MRTITQKNDYNINAFCFLLKKPHPPASPHAAVCVNRRRCDVELQKQVVDNSDSVKHPPEDCNYRPWAIIA
jgi:hypothetical protein